MSKPYGLIVPNKSNPESIKRPSIFDSDSDSDDSFRKPTGLKKPLKTQDKIVRNKAIEEDPTVYQYDEIYDEMDKKRKESKLSRKDLDKKPKYISKLLAAADRRKRENERRIERQVQKERELEGEEFKDKESFVTGAYKQKLEEMKELEMLEKREEYLESIGDVTKQGNLDGFYRHLYDQKVNYEVTKIKTEICNDDNEIDKSPKLKRKYRKRANSNSHDEETEIKKEHLPSNLDADSDFSIDSSDSEESALPVAEKQTKFEIEIKIETKPKEKMEESAIIEEKIEIDETKPKSKINIWKKRTIGEAFDAALQRYLDRKSQREL